MNPGMIIFVLAFLITLVTSTVDTKMFQNFTALRNPHFRTISRIVWMIRYAVELTLAFVWWMLWHSIGAEAIVIFFLIYDLYTYARRDYTITGENKGHSHHD